MLFFSFQINFIFFINEMDDEANFNILISYLSQSETGLTDAFGTSRLEEFDFSRNLKL